MNSVLITGASRGIGAAAARLFSSKGWEVLLLGRDEERLNEVASRLKGPSTIIPCDLNDLPQVSHWTEEITSQKLTQNPLTALINNAGILIRSSFENSTDEDWQELMATNLIGPARLTRMLLPSLKSNSASIVNIASTAGLRPVANMSAYCATKAAMINWTQVLALELAPHQVRVNCVCPGIVETPIHDFYNEPVSSPLRQELDTMQPLGRLGTPHDIAHAIFNFCSPEASWITGAVLAVDGGISLL